MSQEPIAGVGPPRPPIPPLPENEVHGTSSAGAGVLGESNTGPGVSGRSVIYGDGNPPKEPIEGGNSDGVLGEGSNGVHGVSRGGVGVLGENTGAGYGVSGSTNSNFQPGPDVTAGVWGQNRGSGAGVKGASSGGDGVVGFSGSSVHSGVSAVNDSGGFGLWARGTPAGHFEGKVEVAGDLTAGNISGATVTCLNGLNTIGSVSHIGNVHVRGDVACDGDISLTHADCAEDFDVSGCEEVRPGSVMVINDEGNLIPSSQAYDRRVAGVVSGAGGLQPGIVLGRRSGSTRTPIALIGKVYCQVDAGFSPIEVGDLLTTSSVQGHAMKATDPVRAFGAVIGKALRPMAQGRAIIPVLVALQ